MAGNDYANLVDFEPLLSLPPSNLNSFINSSTNRTAVINAEINVFRNSVTDAFNAGIASVTPIYRLRGYHIDGATHEFWTGSSTTTPNPSGNPLVNIVVDSVLQ